MDLEYNREITKYGRADAFTALCIFVLFAALSVADWVLIENFVRAAPILQFSGRFIVTGIVFALVIIKKQGLSSIGFSKDNLRQAIIFTVPIIIIFSAFGVIPGLVYGWQPHSFGVLAPAFAVTALMAAGEDIFFVGFLQTRLYGLFKHHIPAIAAGAVLFALIHMPIGLLASPFPAGWAAMWIIWIIGHVLMVLIFRRQFSIIPVITAHTLANFFVGGSLWSYFNADYNVEWASTAVLLILAVLVIWEAVCHVKKKRREAAQ